MRWWIAVLWGCTSGTLTIPTSETGSSVGGDTDTSGDTSTDTGSAWPLCPFAGSWTIDRVQWLAGDDWYDLDVVGSAEIAGELEACSVVFDVVVNDSVSVDCHIVETVELTALFDTTWEGWSDGGGMPPCRDSALGARQIGPVTIDVDGDGLGLLVEGGPDNYLQFVAYPADQRVVLARAAG